MRSGLEWTCPREPMPAKSAGDEPLRYAALLMSSHSSLSRMEHRPWPLPEAAWVWRQSWRDLLFAHWPVPAATLRSLVPDELEIQEFDGTSWVGVVPFRMAGVMRRPLPDLPYFSAFPELNLRLYVEAEGKPGVWFLSLDAENVVAVVGARVLYNLPYFHASIEFTDRGGEIAYASRRTSWREGPAFRATYRPVGEAYESRPGSLESWLTERYCLYARTRSGRIRRVEIHHVPWPLQKAEAEIEANTLSQPHGFSLHGDPVLLHFSRRIDVAIWPSAAVFA